MSKEDRAWSCIILTLLVIFALSLLGVITSLTNSLNELRDSFDDLKIEIQQTINVNSEDPLDKLVKEHTALVREDRLRREQEDAELH
jgi:hypothetical protein